MKHQQLIDVLAWTGHKDPGGLFERLDRFAGWLAEEGVEAGGIGPDEGTTIWERHVLDSLMFAVAFPDAPEALVDLGSGLGLPGLPLALLFPATDVLLVDRSDRRMRLARRAARICGAGNLRTRTAEFDAVASSSADAVVMRAALPAGEAEEVAGRVAAPGGRIAIGVGVSGGERPEGTLERFPGSAVLDPGRWLHIMRR